MNCIICHSHIAQGTWNTLFSFGEPERICTECNESLEKISGEICDDCGRPLNGLDSDYIQGNLCYDCFRWRQDPTWSTILIKNRSIFLYNDFLKQVLSQYKFRGDYILATAFQKSLTKAFKEHFDPSSIIVPIPLSQERLYERGFNQSKVFAEFLGKLIQEPLTRKHLEKQSKKSRNERIETENVFILNSNVDFTGKEILLIDDIYTTGSTIRQAAKVLKEAGASKVSSLTLARS